MWIFKQLFELFDISLGLIAAKLSKFIFSIYEKSVNVLKDAEIAILKYHGRKIKYAKISIETIRRVQQRIIAVIASDAKFLKLLNPQLLHEYATTVPSCMVSKFGSLQWIEPETEMVVAPKYNLYWSEFWKLFFMRNFKISEELCFMIAEYMPKKLRRETFLDYFCRKYDAEAGCFIGNKAFDITITVRKNHIQTCDITIVF